MCFSATASFSASAILVSVGAYCIYKTCKQDIRYLPFGIMPLCYGIQQLLEGFVWVGFNSNNISMIKYASFGFLFFAFALWPALCPVSAAYVESKKSRKKLMKIFTVVGVTLGLLIYIPLLYGGTTFTTSIVKDSILYETSRPLLLKNIYTLLYMIIIIVPFVICSKIKVKVYGYLLLLSVIISFWKLYYAFFSIWCFMAAFLSMYIIYMINDICLHKRIKD